ADAWAGGGAGPFQGTLRGGYFNENRNNGTPATINATITRGGAGSAHGVAGGGVREARGDASFPDYRQAVSGGATGDGGAGGRAADESAVGWIARPRSRRRLGEADVARADARGLHGQKNARESRRGVLHDVWRRKRDHADAAESERRRPRVARPDRSGIAPDA